MTRVPILSPDAIAELRRDHDRLRMEVGTLRVIVRQLQSQLEGPGRRMFARIELTSDLADTDGTCTADILRTFGPGADHADKEDVTLHNEPTGTLSTYRYFGSTGARGWALYDRRTREWHLFDLDCPPEA